MHMCGRGQVDEAVNLTLSIRYTRAKYQGIGGRAVGRLYKSVVHSLYIVLLYQGTNALESITWDAIFQHPTVACCLRINNMIPFPSHLGFLSFSFPFPFFSSSCISQSPPPSPQPVQRPPKTSHTLSNLGNPHTLTLTPTFSPRNSPLDPEPRVGLPGVAQLPRRQRRLGLLDLDQLLDLEDHARELRRHRVEDGLHAAAEAQGRQHAARPLRQPDRAAPERYAEEGRGGRHSWFILCGFVFLYFLFMVGGCTRVCGQVGVFPFVSFRFFCVWVGVCFRFIFRIGDQSTRWTENRCKFRFDTSAPYQLQAKRKPRFDVPFALKLPRLYTP